MSYETAMIEIDELEELIYLIDIMLENVGDK